MTGEQFHDVLTLLPEDLVAQADKIGSRKPKIIRWKQHAAIAACLAVLVPSAVFVHTLRQESASTGMVAETFAATKQEAADAAEAPRIEAAHGSARPYPCVETPSQPNAAAIDCSAAIVTDAAELEAYFGEMGEFYQLDALQDACDAYDADWFASYDLLLIPADGVSGTCAVTDVSCQGESCTVAITISEESAAPTNYRAAVPVEKGAVTDTGNITINYISDTNS